MRSIIYILESIEMMKDILPYTPRLRFRRKKLCLFGYDLDGKKLIIEHFNGTDLFGSVEL